MSAIAYADGPGGPRSSPAAVAAAVGGLEGEPSVFLGWTIDERPWLADPTLSGEAILPGYALAGAVAGGRLRYRPTPLSTVAGLLGSMRPEVGVVAGVRRGRGLALAGSVGWAPAVVASARSLVVEVADDALDLGGADITASVAAVLDAPPRGRVIGARAPDDVDRAVAANVASVVPDGATVQLGLGVIPDAVADALHRPVAVWSGLVTDAVAGLHDRGLLLGVATAAYGWGDRVHELVGEGRLRLTGVHETHDARRMPGLVAVNSALQVGLDGSANVERIGDRVVAGIGGLPDFAGGAALSIIALRSTARDGSSTIVEHLDTVSIPPVDIDVVVTEHGVADLRGVAGAERAQRLLRVGRARSSG